MQPADPPGRWLVGVDVGGTFTDVVLVDAQTGASAVAKLLNRDADPAETVVRGIARLLRDLGAGPESVRRIGHGTTITTNAVIERKGARTALITNRGFRDILEIGRFARPAELIYRIHADKPPPLVPRRLRLGLACRVDRDGAVAAEIDPDELAGAIATLKREAVDSVAICFLFSFLEPRHEEEVRAAIAAALPSVETVLSSEILREFREFPRTSTTVFAAFVAPVLRGYVAGLTGRLRRAGLDCPLHLFQSNGGVAGPEIVMRNPALTLLSGPAGAVVGAAEACARAGHRDLITMDIGGTSLDVCLIRDGQAEITTGREIDLFPVAMPMLGIHTIGAGGGSVVRVDGAGRVTVGPDSMGARPGPACYGLGGEEATLTDINLLMGLLRPDGLAGGEVVPDRVLAERAVRQRVAGPLGVGLGDAVAGVYRVAASQIAGAIRTISVEQGTDPRDYALVAFGGGGPLHAAAVARELGMRRIIVPRHPGLFSARGIATADFSHDHVLSLVRPVAELNGAEIAARLRALAERAEADLAREGVAAPDRGFACSLDLRYVGQTTEIPVPLPDAGAAAVDLDAAVARFHALHEQRYSYKVPGEPVELVNLRLRATGRTAKPAMPGCRSAPVCPAPAGARPVLLAAGREEEAVPVYRREALSPGAAFAGPALVDETSSTTLVPAGMNAIIDGWENLVITDGAGGA